MEQRQPCKKMLRLHLATFKLSLCRIVFIEWAACKPNTFLNHHYYSHLFLAQMITIGAARHWAQVSLSFELVRAAAVKAVWRDKQLHLESLVAKADKAAERGDIKQVYNIARCAAGMAHREVKVVAWEDGSKTTSEAEYYRRLQDHFQSVFGAVVVPTLADLGIPQPPLPDPAGRHDGPPLERVS